MAEGVVIIASVLLALAADATWAAVQSREAALRDLRAVLAELRDRRRTVERGYRLHQRALAGSTAIFNQLSAVDEDEPLEVPDTLATQLHWVIVSEPASPVLESFVQAGHLQYLADIEIGPALLRWKARVDDMHFNEARAARHIDDQLLPYVTQQFGYVGARDIPPGRTTTLSGSPPGTTHLRSTRYLRGLVVGQISFLTLLTLSSGTAMPVLDSLIARIEDETR